MYKQKITTKQFEILVLLYRYRFLNRIQLQKFLNHKSTNRINSWLKELYEQKYIGRYFINKIGENNKPAIYYLITKSKKLLISNASKLDMEFYNLNRLYRERYRSKKFMDKHIFLADIQFYLQESLNKDQELAYITKIELEKFNYLPQPIPDAYIAISDRKETKRYFLEIIDSDIPRFVARNRIIKYCDFVQSHIWETFTDYDIPKVLLVFNDNKLKDYMLKFIPRYLEEELIDNISFNLATKENIEKSKFKYNVWEKAE